MRWRRLAEVLRLRRAVQLMEERDAYDRAIERNHQEVEELAKKTAEQSEAAEQMTEQSRLGSYGRVRIKK